MSEPPDSDAPPPIESADRAIFVALIAAVAAVAWCFLVLGKEAVLLLLFAAPASALLWFVIASHLEDCRSGWRRLWLALGLGVVSPIPGLVLAWLPSWCCVSPCFPGVAAGMFVHLWTAPLLWLPVGAGMGLVAFAVVSVRRAPPAP